MILLQSLCVMRRCSLTSQSAHFSPSSSLSRRVLSSVSHRRSFSHPTPLLQSSNAAPSLPKLIQSIRKEAIRGRNEALPSLRRAFSLYDQINLIDKVPEDQLRFQGYTETGFTVNGIDREGSLLCIGNLLLSWAPTTLSQVTPQSLSIFQIVRPIPEILILGCGRHIQHVDPELRHFVRSTGMKLEAVDTRNAASTYNILSEEGRIVAAALLPHGVTS